MNFPAIFQNIQLDDPLDKNTEMLHNLSLKYVIF